MKLSKLASLTGLFSAVLYVSVQCTSAHAKSWDFQNDPTRIDSNFDLNIHTMPKQGALERHPWSSTYWPAMKGGINYRWHAQVRRGFNLDSPSLAELRQMSKAEIAELAPSEKYDIAMGRYDYPLVSEVASQTSPRAKDWAGICNGWAPAAYMFPEPTTVEFTNPDGIVIPFGSSDVKGLLSQYMAFHSNGNVTQIGYRCSKAGRIFGTKQCKDINPGAMHVVLSNMLGIQQKGFVLEIDPAEEVWNQPIYSFKTTVTGSTSSGVRVHTTLVYGDELDDSSWEPVVSTANNVLSTLELDYTLDLDRNGNITGGDWISGYHPDFLWTIDQPKEFNGYFSGLSDIYKGVQ